jgi:hypothetical protein
VAKAEAAAIAAVEAQLGEPLREDGPPLGVEFDPLPPGAFSGNGNEMQSYFSENHICLPCCMISIICLTTELVSDFYFLSGRNARGPWTCPGRAFSTRENVRDSRSAKQQDACAGNTFELVVSFLFLGFVLRG